MPGRLEQKVALITGGAQGIGRAAALLFAREGATVFLADLQDEAGEEAVSEIIGHGGVAHYLHCDVSSESDVTKVISGIEDACGNLHVLYNNASIYMGGVDNRITDVDSQTWDRVIAVNLRSVYLCCKHGIPLMLRSGTGSVINTASSAGVIGIPNCDVYTASKGATVSLTRSMAVEYGPHGIRVNCIAPAGIRTGMMSVSNLEDKSYDESSYVNLRQPLRRYGTPDEVAHVALFLASEESSFVNGAIIVADGGVTICGDLSKCSQQ